jgi:two-component system response regulator HydG
VDVRLVAATNGDLDEAIQRGTFREDLYYRLNVVNIMMPSLRARKEDIEPLAGHFIEIYARELKKDVKGLLPEALRVLYRYNWPGNVRELQNTMERAVLMTEAQQIRAEDISTLGRQGAAAGSDSMPVHLPPQGMDLEEIEKMVLLEALKMSNWVQKEAAALLNISSRAMNYKVKKFAITHPTWKKNREPEEESDGAHAPRYDGLATRVTNR